MRKLILLGLPIVLFTACQEKQAQRYFATKEPETE